MLKYSSHTLKRTKYSHIHNTHGERHVYAYCTSSDTLCTFSQSGASPPLTLYGLGVRVGIGEVGGGAQGTAVGTGLDAGGLEEQWGPCGALPQPWHVLCHLRAPAGSCTED